LLLCARTLAPRDLPVPVGDLARELEFGVAGGLGGLAKGGERLLPVEEAVPASG
jgi:hypothetical protein